jgi:hypothetical protein
MNNRSICWVFHAYINDMHGSRSKFPIKNLVRQRCANAPQRYAVRTLPALLLAVFKDDLYQIAQTIYVPFKSMSFC